MLENSTQFLNVGFQALKIVDMNEVVSTYYSVMHSIPAPLSQEHSWKSRGYTVKQLPELGIVMNYEWFLILSQ